MRPFIFSLFFHYGVTNEALYFFALFHYILQVVNDAAPYCAILLMDGNQSLFKGLICHGRNYRKKSCIQMPFSFSYSDRDLNNKLT